MAVSGRYAYVTSPYTDRLTIIDISDPANLVSTGFTSTNLESPNSVAVSGRYAYVTDRFHRLVVFELNHLGAHLPVD